MAKSIESSLAQPKPSAWEFPATFTPSSVAINVADELLERDKRKCNIVVHNLPESPTDNSQSDTNSFLEICRGSLDLNVEVIKSSRLGQNKLPDHVGYCLNLVTIHHVSRFCHKPQNSDFQTPVTKSTYNQT